MQVDHFHSNTTTFINSNSASQPWNTKRFRPLKLPSQPLTQCRLVVVSLRPCSWYWAWRPWCCCPSADWRCSKPPCVWNHALSHHYCAWNSVRGTVSHRESILLSVQDYAWPSARAVLSWFIGKTIINISATAERRYSFLNCRCVVCLKVNRRDSV